MAQLRRDYDKFQALGVEILVVGPDGPGAFKKYWTDEHLPFTGLPDPKASVLKMYGQEVNMFKMGRMPAQAIIDRSGTVRYVHYGHSMSDIPENAELLELLKTLSDS
jgi:peroxiredoxin Q/BCP